MKNRLIRFTLCLILPCSWARAAESKVILGALQSVYKTESASTTVVCGRSLAADEPNGKLYFWQAEKQLPIMNILKTGDRFAENYQWQDVAVKILYKVRSSCAGDKSESFEGPAILDASVTAQRGNTHQTLKLSGSDGCDSD